MGSQFQDERRAIWLSKSSPLYISSVTKCGIPFVAKTHATINITIRLTNGIHAESFQHSQGSWHKADCTCGLECVCGSVPPPSMAIGRSGTFAFANCHGSTKALFKTPTEDAKLARLTELVKNKSKRNAALSWLQYAKSQRRWT